MGDSFGNDEHLARLERDRTKLRLPVDSSLVTKDQLVAVHVAMPKTHRLFGALGKVEANAFGLKQRQDGAFGARILMKYFDFESEFRMLRIRILIS